MNNFKAIVTLTWDFETELDQIKALQLAKKQLVQILDTNPQGEEFQNYSIQINLSNMRPRKRLIHLGVFSLEEVLPYISKEPVKRSYQVGDKLYSVRMNSDRYWVFHNNHTCVVCGLVGTKMILDMNPSDMSPHFNLYAELNGRLVLMTKDHIVPKSKKGPESLNNFQTMCSHCNNLKSSYNLTLEQCRELKRIADNVDRIPKKELRTLINRRREELAALNEEKSYGEQHSFGYDSSESTAISGPEPISVSG